MPKRTSSNEYCQAKAIRIYDVYASNVRLMEGQYKLLAYRFGKIILSFLKTVSLECGYDVYRINLNAGITVISVTRVVRSIICFSLRCDVLRFKYQNIAFGRKTISRELFLRDTPRYALYN